MRNYTERFNDVTKAIQLLRKQGLRVGFPMQTPNGDVIFAVGTDNFTLTSDELLELLDRDELHADGVLRIVEAQADKQRRQPGTRKKAASS